MREYRIGRPRRRQQAGMDEAAWKGATAGLAGGVAMLAMNEVVARGLLPGDEEAPPRRGPAIRRGARRAVRKGAQQLGVRLTGDQREASAIAMELVAAAAIGALFGVVSSRLPLPAAATGPLLGALVYGATLSGLLPGGGLLAPAGAVSLGEALRPVGSQALFGSVTARAFELLAER